MYYFILKKDLSNNDTSSLINKNGGRVHTQGDMDNLLENDEENTMNFDKIINTCYVKIF